MPIKLAPNKSPTVASLVDPVRRMLVRNAVTPAAIAQAFGVDVPTINQVLTKIGRAHV